MSNCYQHGTPWQQQGDREPKEKQNTPKRVETRFKTRQLQHVERSQGHPISTSRIARAPLQTFSSSAQRGTEHKPTWTNARAKCPETRYCIRGPPSARKQRRHSRHLHHEKELISERTPSEADPRNRHQKRSTSEFHRKVTAILVRHLDCHLRVEDFEEASIKITLLPACPFPTAFRHVSAHDSSSLSAQYACTRMPEELVQLHLVPPPQSFQDEVEQLPPRATPARTQ